MLLAIVALSMGQSCSTCSTSYKRIRYLAFCGPIRSLGMKMNQGTFRSSDGCVSGGVWSGGGSVSMKNSDGSYTSYGWG